MYRDAYQHGMLSVFFSGGSKPLGIWETHIQDGSITRFLDDDLKSMVLEIRGTNVSTTYMICPKGKAVLGIHMPFMVMIVKNLKKYFSFEVTILDDTGTRRRFRVANFQSTSQILPMSTAMPIGLSDGWNQIQFDLAKFTQKAYQKQFVEVQKLKINANIRLRRIYFARRLIPDDELPAEYKLYFPLPSKGRKRMDKAKMGEQPEVKSIIPPAGELKQTSKEAIEAKISQKDMKRVSQEKEGGAPAEVAEPALAVEGIPAEVEKVPSGKEVGGEEGVAEPDEVPAEAPPEAEVPLIEVPAENVEDEAVAAEMAPKDDEKPPEEEALPPETGHEEPADPVTAEVQEATPAEATSEPAETPAEG